MGHAATVQSRNHLQAVFPLQPWRPGRGAGELAAYFRPGGCKPDGSLEQGFEAQARRAWANLIAVLEAGGMERGDLVKVNVLLTRASDVPASRGIRDEALQGAAPASTLLVISALAHPDLLFEVEAVAARPA
jgi:Putative translation initiation inhibitor, yjgF family